METDKLREFKVIKFGFSSAWVDYCNDKGLLNEVKEKRYKASELEVSRRVLSHWRGLGLIDLYGDDPHSTRLSFLEIFWLQTAIELRLFGLSLDKITSIKNHFFRESKLPIFEAYLVRSIYQDEKDFFLLVAADGRADMGTKEEVDTSEAFGLLEAGYIKLNFNVIKNAFVTYKLNTVNQKNINKALTDKEASILDLIRTGNYKEISLKFKNGVISHISKKSLELNPNPFHALQKIIAAGDDFCEISLKRQDGKFVVMEKSVTEKP